MTKNPYADYLIIGGGIAGVAAAEDIRELDPYSKIIIISNEKDVLYSRVMLAEYISGRFSKDQLYLRRIGDYVDKDIELWLDESAILIERNKKKVITKKERSINYNKLLICSGSESQHIDIEKSDRNPFFTLRGLEDAERIKKYLSINKVSSALVIGSGLLALDFISMLSSFKFDISLIINGNHLFSHNISKEGSDIIESVLRRKGVKNIIRNTNNILNITKGSNCYSFKLSEKEKIVFDAVFIAVGTSRNIDVYKSAGLKCDVGILVDEYLKTNDKNIYAAGDVCQYKDNMYGKNLILGNWINSFLQGRTAAENMTGGNKMFENVPVYSLSHDNFHIDIIGIYNKKECTSIINSDQKNEIYEELIFSDNILIGAFLINKSSQSEIIRDLVKKKVKYDNVRAALAGVDSDLKSLINEK